MSNFLIVPKHALFSLLVAEKNLYRNGWKLFLLILFLLGLAIDQAAASEQTCGSDQERVREGDTIWLVSTRHLGCSTTGEDPIPLLHISRFDASQGWVESSAKNLTVSITTEISAVVYTHGNRIEHCGAISRGWTAYHRLTCSGDELPPMHFIIWSWPSSQIRGPRQDIQVKAARTNIEGYYLASLVSQFPVDARVSLIGFSFGARISTGAMHVLGGGSLSGRSLPGGAWEGTHHLSTILYAAALHNYWLLPGCRHEMALASGGEILNLYNCCDPALNRYHRISKQSNPVALGYVGCAAASRHGQYVESNVSCQVGCEHDLFHYLCSPTIMAMTRAAMTNHSQSVGDESVGE